MSASFARGPLVKLFACALLSLSAASCAAVQRYAQVTGRDACASFDQCTVYDGEGKHEVACFQPWGTESPVLADDSGWPLSTASCRSGRVVPRSAG
jgi:hypothetical protein